MESAQPTVEAAIKEHALNLVRVGALAQQEHRALHESADLAAQTKLRHLLQLRDIAFIDTVYRLSGAIQRWQGLLCVRFRSRGRLLGALLNTQLTAEDA